MNTENNTNTMKLVIFGGTRGTGRYLVEQALAAGHFVTALVRDPARLALEHPRLTVVAGDAADYGAVESAVRGQDAVLSALGAPALKRTSVRSDGTRNMIRAMEQHGLERLISLSSLGVGDSRESLPFATKYIVVPLFLRRAFADHELQETHIRESGLAWTIVRPPYLTKGERSGRYVHGAPLPTKGVELEISRADVADFMLQQLNDQTYVHRTPGLAMPS